MISKVTKNLLIVLCTIALTNLSSCSKIKSTFNTTKSSTTGWTYNSKGNGGFQYESGYSQKTGPGLVFIPGGTFVMGKTIEDVMGDCNNAPRRVTVASFYMDETEVRNIDYLEYLHWLKRVYVDNPEVYKKALPDTMAWRSTLAYNEPMVRNYLRFKAYAEYPVVGVSWEQARDYCVWRTDRVNEQILIDKGILRHDPESQRGENVFTTETYLTGMYQGTVKNNLKDLNGNPRHVEWTDGMLLPQYRLPTEAEWEYAAYGLIGNTTDEKITNKRTFPWDGAWVRNPDKKHRGKMMANFVRSKGDYMGVAGSHNDGGDFTMPVGSFWPNDFGLYCMAGNVNEWCSDVYRQLSFSDVAEFNPFRGNVFKVRVKDEDGNLVKDSLGRIKYRLQTKDELTGRKNYRKADNRNYNDGDLKSRISNEGNWTNGEDKGTSLMYNNDGNKVRSLVSDSTRVYKGGSWKDRVYWLCPGTRRYLHQKSASNDIGFRCAMSHVGSPDNNPTPKIKKRKKSRKK